MLKYGMVKFNVIIPAAGSGSRMGAETPKQYILLLGKPLIEHTLAVFCACLRINRITVVLSPDDAFCAGEIVSNPKIQIRYCGGDTRAASVLNGLLAMRSDTEADDWILVHDAARPCLSAALLEHLLTTLESDAVGGLLAIPVADTLKRADPSQHVARTESRDNLWLAQTPQMFRYRLLTNALKAANGAPTDEAQAVEALGLKPKLVLGDSANLKVTYPQDLLLAQAILQGTN